MCLDLCFPVVGWRVCNAFRWLILLLGLVDGDGVAIGTPLCSIKRGTTAPDKVSQVFRFFIQLQLLRSMRGFSSR